MLPRRKANEACPVGHGISTAMNGVISAAQQALEQELARITLASFVKTVQGSCQREQV